MSVQEQIDLMRAYEAYNRHMKRIEEGAGRFRLAFAAASALTQSDYYIKHWYRVPEIS
jgi:hypothetical protein